MLLLVVEQVPPCYGIKKKLLAFHNQLFFYPHMPFKGKSALGMDSYRLKSENLPAAGWFFSQKDSYPVGAALSRECIAPEGAPTEMSIIFCWVLCFGTRRHG
jgi:hypothetical protein